MEHMGREAAGEVARWVGGDGNLTGRDNVRERGDLGLEQRAFDSGTVAGAVSGEQRCEDAAVGVQAGLEVGHCDAHLAR